MTVINKLSQRTNSYELWYDLFVFCLDYISINIDCLWDNVESQAQIMILINENPLIIEAIVEKSMKFCIKQRYEPNHKIIRANIELLRKLRNIKSNSNFEIINHEQERKLNTILVDESKMLKWIITDKIDKLLHKSDLVQIDNHNFFFYAERNKREYSGLKIFTSLKTNKDNLVESSVKTNERKFIQKNYLNKAKFESHALNELHNNDNNKSCNIIHNQDNQVCKRDDRMQHNLTIYSQIRCSVKKPMTKNCRQNSEEKYKIETPITFTNIIEDK